MTAYGVLGTGIVGQTLAAKLASLGHEVRMGTRDVEAARARTDAGHAGAMPLASWLAENPDVQLVTFSDAIAGSEILVNATSGTASSDVLRGADADDLDGKILIDIGNPLDSSSGQLDLQPGVTDSLGEALQREFATVRVVKALNMMTAAVMVDPASVGNGEHTAFIAGNHDAAKSTVTTLLHSFGWRDVRDLGDIAAARGMEAYLMLWLRTMQTFGSPMFNIKLVM
jgi:8-hydroxy-5-deazaflavin:NADPH oxidoreductase